MTDELEQIDNHVEDAETLLLEQFKNSTKLKNLLGSFTAQIQTIEDMLIDLWQARWLDNAEGQQLDGLGSIVGVDRNGDTDTQYRIRIRARIYSNVSNGTPDDIIRVAKLLLPNVTVNYTEEYPAGFVLDLVGDNIEPEAVDTAFNAIDDASPAGVSFQILYETYPVENLLLFADDFDADPGYPDGEASVDQGWADYQSTQGGHVAGIASNGS